MTTYTEAQWKERFKDFEGDQRFPSHIIVEWDDPTETPTEAIERLNREVYNSRG